MLLGDSWGRWVKVGRKIAVAVRMALVLKDGSNPGSVTEKREIIPL